MTIGRISSISLVPFYQIEPRHGSHVTAVDNTLGCMAEQLIEKESESLNEELTTSLRTHFR